MQIPMCRWHAEEKKKRWDECVDEDMRSLGCTG